jgi:lysophospholipase L1-like esterase
LRIGCAVVVGMVLAGPVGFGQTRGASSFGNWVTSWGASEQAPEPQNGQPGVDAETLTDVTVRQVVPLSMGGAAVRVELSNTFGTKALRIDSVHVARPLHGAPSSAIDPATDRAVTFGGETSVTIPEGAKYVSDPVVMNVPALANLTISFHLSDAPVGQTAHPGSHATSWLLHGEHTGEANHLVGAVRVVRWFQLAAVDVSAPAKASAVIAFGDSITDGHGATTDGNDRWPNVLARRLQGAGMPVAVVNEGMGGNHLLTDGNGANALARMDRDVLSQEGVRFLIVLEGTNDLGMLARARSGTPEEHRLLVGRMIAAYEQIVLRAHAHGLKVIGGTITPYVGSDYYAPTAVDEADRVAVNAWIRAPGHFDAVVDFDKVVRDPADPSRMLPAFDSGDHIHPGPAGYKAMGEAIPLGLFR